MEKFSFGIGDRFAHQGHYQLQAFCDLEDLGVKVTPVWNKSHREHITVGSEPKSVRTEADNSISTLAFKEAYYVDADHINSENVDGFLESSDFFTIDVANKIGESLSAKDRESFLKAYGHLLEPFKIEGISGIQRIVEEKLVVLGDNFFAAAKEASRIYDIIKAYKKDSPFLVEISMDEVELPQSPIELFFILNFLADHNIPVNNVAPKFIGRFNKGIDYEGDLERFEEDFEKSLLVINHAIVNFGLPSDLKLSVHTGSDKFSIYPVINRLIKKYNAGLHLKTAVTTWLEELIGLAEGGVDGFTFVKKIYKEAMGRYDELTEPYSTVLNIDISALPTMGNLQLWSSEEFVDALRHNPMNFRYNKHLRQLLHTAYKIAAEHNDEFYSLLNKHEAVVGKNVKDNILNRHLKPLFL